jgi:hypothetical protein
METEEGKVARLSMKGNCEGYRHLFADLRALFGAEEGQPDWLPVMSHPKVNSEDVMRLLLAWNAIWRKQCGKH